MKDDKAFCLFVKILLSVDYQTGQLTTGRDKLVKLTGFPSSTVYKVLQRLVREDIISIEADASRSVITICNWKKWQKNSSKNDEKWEQPREQERNNFVNNPENNPEIRKNENGNNPVNNVGISSEQPREHYTRIEEEGRNNNILSSSSPSADKKAKNNEARKKQVEHLISIIGNREKPTPSRISALNARLKEYTFEEIVAATKAFSKSLWHKQNKQLSIDNLLAPSKIGRWHNEATTQAKPYVIPGSVPTKPTSVPIDDRQRTPEQKERGRLILELARKHIKLSSVSDLSNKELADLLANSS